MYARITLATCARLLGRSCTGSDTQTRARTHSHGRTYLHTYAHAHSHNCTHNTQVNISAEESKYEALAADLLAWITATILRLRERDLPNTLPEVQAVNQDFKRYVCPPRANVHTPCA